MKIFNEKGELVTDIQLDSAGTSKGRDILYVVVEDFGELKELMEKSLYILARIEKHLLDTVDEEIEQPSLEKELRELKVDI